MKVFQIILAIIFPPLAVLIRWGFGKKFGLDFLLTLLGWVPGVIYAIGLIFKPKHELNAAR